MSISDVARFTGLHWEPVKDIEKAWLEKKYRKVRLGEVEYLGIEEVYLGKVIGFIALVRDLDSGRFFSSEKARAATPWSRSANV